MKAQYIRLGQAIWAEEGINGFYKSLGPLWGRQIPYTMMKFACFERTVEVLYKHVVPKPRAECSKGEQLIVTFAAGYIAGGLSLLSVCSSLLVLCSNWSFLVVEKRLF